YNSELKGLNTVNRGFYRKFMKRWSLYTVYCSLALMLSAAVTVHAQEAGMSDMEVVVESESSETEKMIFSPGEEVRYVPSATSASSENDSMTLQIYDFPMQQAIMKTPENTDDKKD